MSYAHLNQYYCDSMGPYMYFIYCTGYLRPQWTLVSVRKLVSKDTLFQSVHVPYMHIGKLKQILMWGPYFTRGYQIDSEMGPCGEGKGGQFPSVIRPAGPKSLEKWGRGDPFKGRTYIVHTCSYDTGVQKYWNHGGTITFFVCLAGGRIATF